jgi:hypothetical protein
MTHGIYDENKKELRVQAFRDWEAFYNALVQEVMRRGGGDEIKVRESLYRHFNNPTPQSFNDALGKEEELDALAQEVSQDPSPEFGKKVRSVKEPSGPSFLDVAQYVVCQSDMWASVFKTCDRYNVPGERLAHALLFDSDIVRAVIDDLESLATSDKTRQQVKIPPNISLAITFDSYQNDMGEAPFLMKREAVFLHGFYLTSCLVRLTNNNLYVVKQRIEGREKWNTMERKALVDIIDLRVDVGEVIDGKVKTRAMRLGDFLNEPNITQAILQFDRETFYRDDPHLFSMWRGHIHERLSPEDLAANIDIIAPFLDFVLNVICAGDRYYFRYEMMKNAWVLQNPDKHPRSATVLIGDKGVGKNTYTDILCDLWGLEWSCPNMSSIAALLDDKSKSIIHMKKLIVCNELTADDEKAGKKANWDMMKTRISDDNQLVRDFHKGFPSTPIESFAYYIFLSNHRNSIPIETGERRYFCLEVSSDRKGDGEFFTLMKETLRKHTPLFFPTLLTYFLEMDVSSFDPNASPPETPLMREMQETAMSLPEQFITDSWWWRNGIPKRFADGIVWVRGGDEGWDLFNRWKQEKQIDEERGACSRNQFVSKVAEKVQVKKSSWRYWRPYDPMLKGWLKAETESYIRSGRWCGGSDAAVDWDVIWLAYATYMNTHLREALSEAEFMEVAAPWVIVDTRNKRKCIRANKELMFELRFDRRQQEEPEEDHDDEE